MTHEPHESFDTSPVSDARVRTRSRARPKTLDLGRTGTRRALRWGAIALGCAVCVGVTLALWSRERAEPVREMTVAGMEITTNQPVHVSEGSPYLLISVNTDPARVVLRTAHEPDDAAIEHFLSTVDTLVPGEHLIEVKSGVIHVLVDGLPEE